MFGLRRSGARIRARVRPVQPRAKRPSRRPEPRRVPMSAAIAVRRPNPESPTRKSAEKDEGEEVLGKAAHSAPGTIRGQSRQDQGSGQNGSRKARSHVTHQTAEASDREAGAVVTPTAGARSPIAFSRPWWPRACGERFE